MAARRVFVISGAGLVAYHRHGSKLLGPFPFGADEDGRAEFTRYLDRFPDEITHVVADVVEEEFREETIPHVLAWERGALMRARAARAFPGARYLHAARLGREPDGRRDDRVRLSAITRPETLAGWLAAMEERGVPLAGIHSPAMLTAPMLKAVGAVGEHVLVVSQQSGGGLRQTCFRGGKLRFSRLATLPHPAAGGHESHILAEIERTRRYLRNPGNLANLASRGSGASGDRLDVHVLSHGAPLEGLRRALAAHDADVNAEDGTGSAGGNDDEDTPARCRVVDLATVARRLGLRRWDGEASADRLFVHLLVAGHPPRNHYATPDQIRRHSAGRTGLALKAGSAVIAVGAGLFGGVVALEGVAARGHADTLAVHATLYERRYRAAQAALPSTPAEPAELERVVSAVNARQRRQADPVDVLAHLSQALADFPRVHIEALSWRTSDDPEAPVSAPGDDRTETRPSGHRPPHDSRRQFQAARFSARIEPFDGDYRAAIDTVRRLADALAAPSGVEHVRILSLPLELGSEHALTGAAGTTGEDATFEMRVTLRADVPDGTET
ncbi:MAG: hypothetical protein OXC25_14625 [Thiotrichales bacterium]|nr:hypothetical protein [Thiotrichales bacterium]